MKTVTFSFDMDQKVVTELGDVGIITALGFDDGGIMYSVKTNTSWNWWKESQIKVKEK